MLVTATATLERPTGRRIAKSLELCALFGSQNGKIRTKGEDDDMAFDETISSNINQFDLGLDISR